MLQCSVPPVFLCSRWYPFSSSSQSSSKPKRKRKKGRGGRRYLAKYQREQKLKENPKPQRRRIKPPKDYMEKLTPATNISDNQEGILPPTMLAPTASPYVYVAKTALYDEDENEVLDSTELFHDARSLPPLFCGAEFQYTSPKQLKFEYPKHGKPEVAFLGRSNVGKSSLINAIMRQKLCLTSKSPGRTQQPYYYGLFRHQKPHHPQRTNADALGYLIDLPGYGFGKPNVEVVDEWQEVTQDLLMSRLEAGVFKRLFLLLDARRGGPTDLDRKVLNWMEDGRIPFSIVLTKADRTSVPQTIKQVNEICMRYTSQDLASGNESPLQSPIVHVTSAKQNWGITELMTSVEAEFLGDDD